MKRHKQTKLACHSLLLLTACLIGAHPAQAAAVLINNACQVGDCSAGNLLAEGDSVSLPFTLNYTFANSDRYQIQGTLGAANRSDTDGFIAITDARLMLTYLGNTSNSASGADTLVIDFEQYFRTPFRTGINNSGGESVSGVFGGPLANASSVQAQGFSNGGLAADLMGPFYAPNAFSESKTDQRFAVGPTTLLQYRNTITFGTGSGIGSTITVSDTPTITPEPSSLLLLATGALLLVSRLRHRSKL